MNAERQKPQRRMEDRGLRMEVASVWSGLANPSIVFWNSARFAKI
jgi:hypothetical protein